MSNKENLNFYKYFKCDRCGADCRYDKDYPYKLCYNCNMELEQEIIQKKDEEIEELNASQSETMKYLNKLRDENKWLRRHFSEKNNKIKELEDYKFRNTDYKMLYESTAKNYQEICEGYKNELDTLKQQLKEKDKEIANLEDIKEIMTRKIKDFKCDLEELIDKTNKQIEEWKQILEGVKNV